MAAQSGQGGSVTMEITDGVAVLTMDRGENRLNIESITQIMGALDQAERDPSVKALVTTGLGKFYCNGIDLKWRESADSMTALKFSELFFKLYMRIMAFPVPTIAAVNGHVYAGGAILAMSHDYRLMRQDRGWFSLNEVHLDMMFADMIAEIMRCKVPKSILTDMVVLGCRFTGPEAKAAGIIKDVYSQEALLSAAINLAKSCQPSSGIKRDSLRNMKLGFYDSVVRAYQQEMASIQRQINDVESKAKL